MLIRSSFKASHKQKTKQSCEGRIKEQIATNHKGFTIHEISHIHLLEK